MTSSQGLTITLNGEQQDLAAGSTVGSLVSALTPARSGVAVAVNGVVLPRSKWDAAVLADNDAVEVLTAVQGG